jgi:hypothetical protein
MMQILYTKKFVHQKFRADVVMIIYLSLTPTIAILELMKSLESECFPVSNLAPTVDDDDDDGVYCLRVEVLRKKEKRGSNSVYHQNW